MQIILNMVKDLGLGRLAQTFRALDDFENISIWTHVRAVSVRLDSEHMPLCITLKIRLGDGNRLAYRLNIYFFVGSFIRGE